MTENHQNNDIREIDPAFYVQSLLAITEEQNRIISELRAENAQLKARIAELEARLNQHSQNSNRPPSMDGFRSPESQRKKGERPPGGHNGHKGHTLDWVEAPDKSEFIPLQNAWTVRPPWNRWNHSKWNVRLDPPGTHPGKSMREGSQQQRRAVRGTVREESAGTAGDEEPATKSRASPSHQPSKRDQGDGAEHGRPSTLITEPKTSGAEAATERSEGVAGAERYQGPGQPAVGRALAASKASSGRMPEARSDVEQSLSHRPWEHLISLCVL